MSSNRRNVPSPERLALLDELAQRDLPPIAEACGLTILRSGATTKALCPFHDDHDPSLRFYVDKSSGKHRFKCFSCGAAGDAFDLVKRLRSCDFPEALEFISSLIGVTVPARVRSGERRRSPRQVGLEQAHRAYSSPTNREKDAMVHWASERRISPQILHEAEVHFAEGNKLVRLFGEDREILDALEVAGLVLRSPRQTGQSIAQARLIEPPPRDLFSRDRVVFSLRDHDGQLVGFAARAATPGDKPKYLFSKNLPKGEILYRLSDVVRRMQDPAKRSKSKKTARVVHLFVVEGLMDTLRLESDGLLAVGVLGSHLTKAQIDRLSDLARRLDQQNGQLCVHLFLDADDAGWRGMLTALPRLLLQGASQIPFTVDAIVPPASHIELSGTDPDSLLAATPAGQALDLIRQWSVSIAQALLAGALGCVPSEVARTWDHSRSAERLAALREVERTLTTREWEAVSAAIGEGVFATAFEAPPTLEDASWQGRLNAFLFERQRSSEVTSAPPPSHTVPESDATRVLSAIQVAQASTQRREVPVDDLSWERLLQASHVTIPFFVDRLGSHANESIEPFVAVNIPKHSGEYRLKALPCPEDLAVQQYLLTELLRSHDNDAPGFADDIPAVRYYSGKPPVTTGADHFRPTTREGKPFTVSYAYQIDMDVLDGQVALRGDGMFRPYVDCWSGFVEFINGRIIAAARRGADEVRLFHTARLDVRKYYDMLPHFAVNDVLFRSLERAVRLYFASGSFAPLFDTKGLNASPEIRAGHFVDCLCRHSFGYKYFHPSDGKPVTTSEERGIPQGPDLSAYLATIALFPLDKRVSDTVEASDDAIVYARYVDDMVIVTRTEAELNRLRGLIESQLGRIGLELSQKGEPLPAMTLTEIQNWLTESRGGLAVSGDFDGPPLNLPPLPDDGGVDRREALVRLRDPDLYHPGTPPEVLETVVAEVHSCSELRFGDRSRAAALVWTIVAKELLTYSLSAQGAMLPASNDSIAGRRGANLFLKTWNRTTGRRDDVGSASDATQTELPDPADLLVWLHGLERFLRSRRFLSPDLTREEQDSVRKSRVLLALEVRQGMCEELRRRYPQADSDKRFSLDLLVSNIYQIAALLEPGGGVERTFEKIVSLGAQSKAASSALQRSAISFAHALRSTESLDWLRTQTRHNSHILFHEAIVRLVVSQGASHDPLQPLAVRVEPHGSSSSHQGMDYLLNVLAWWIPREGDDVPASDAWGPHFLRRTLSALLNLSTQAPAAVFNSHRQLFIRAVGGSPDRAKMWLPCVPVREIPGLVAVDNDGDTLEVMELPFASLTQSVSDDGTVSEENQADGFCPAGLNWTEQRCADFTYNVASLGNWRYLEGPAEPPLDQPGLARWVAAAYRALATQQPLPGDVECPPTAHNLLYPTDDRSPLPVPRSVLGSAIPSNCIRQQAFVRSGTHGLVPERVPDPFGHLWRIGFALADWLRLLDKARSVPSQRFDSPYSSVDESSWGAANEHRWALETLLRASFYQLCGRYLPSGTHELAGEPAFPRSVERVLERLERYPDGVREDRKWTRLAVVLSALVESRVANARTRASLQLNPAQPGAATAMLASLIQEQCRVDARLAEELRSVPMRRSVAPKRRPVLAWSEFADRIDGLAQLQEAETSSPPDLSLRAMAAGARLIAVQTQLRCQALELWHLVPPSERKRFLESADALAEINYWDLGGDSLLHQKDRGESDGGTTAFSNVTSLFLQLDVATRIETRRGWQLLAGVTPLGWLVIFGTTSGLLPSRLKSPQRTETSVGPGVLERIRELAHDFAQASSKPLPHDPPWGDLDEAIKTWSKSRVDTAIELLESLDVVNGMVVEQPNPSTILGLYPGAQGETEVQLPSGTVMLQPWQIVTGSAYRERSTNHVESYRKDGDQRAWFRWTETRRDDCIVGLQVVQPGLAALAGLSTTSETSAPLESASSGLPCEASGPTPNAEGSRQIAEEISEAVTPETGGGSPFVAEPRAAGSQDEFLGGLRRMQNASWGRRALKLPCHLRVALAQWDVDGSYRHPLFDIDPRWFEKNAPRVIERETKRIVCPHHWTSDLADKHRTIPSTAEHRRQCFLKEILRACQRFQVDVLLLPEYSTRPETVTWLQEKLRQENMSTMIWAGTFRKPPFMLRKRHPWLDRQDVRDWAAVLPVVIPPGNPIAESGDIQLRMKKYPAIACTEVFCPYIAPIKPAVSSHPSHLAAKVIELICSEVFLALSPTNLKGLAWTLLDYLGRFGDNLANVPEERLRRAEDAVKEDIAAFADVTSMIAPHHTRRTVVLVPAMTPRAVDYAVLGQASYLASGLTTVFCNAAGKAGHGQSCVIGHDGWDRDDGEPGPGIPCPGPYHGALPGIYRPWDPDRGWLGKKEQAMVIVDIDPYYSMEGKPRPQMLQPPLQLVAHLPVLEVKQMRASGGDSTSSISKASDKRNEGLKCLLRIWQHIVEQKGGPSTIADKHPERLARMIARKIHPERRDVDGLADDLRCLAQVFPENEDWLKKRAAAYEREHAATPLPWASPVALDWLWVEIGEPTSDSEKIEVPPYTLAPGEREDTQGGQQVGWNASLP
jgi:DNA primase catalytic core